MLTPAINVTTTGGAGVSAGTGTNGGFRGLLMSIKVTFTSQPATTDVTITEVGGLGRTLLTLTNVNTTGVYYPRVPLHDTTGVAISGQYAPFEISTALLVTVAQGNDAAPGVSVVFDYIPD